MGKRAYFKSTLRVVLASSSLLVPAVAMAGAYGPSAVKDEAVGQYAAASPSVFCARLGQDIPLSLQEQMDCGAAKPKTKMSLKGIFGRLHHTPIGNVANLGDGRAKPMVSDVSLVSSSNGPDTGTNPAPSDSVEPQTPVKDVVETTKNDDAPKSQDEPNGTKNKDKCEPKGSQSKSKGDGKNKDHASKDAGKGKDHASKDSGKNGGSGNGHGKDGHESNESGAPGHGNS